MSFQPRIAIVGGGPSGLVLGKLLLQSDIHPTIYELGKKPTSDELSKPSTMLYIPEEPAQNAIEECGLKDKFQAAASQVSASYRALDPQAKVLYEEGSGSTRQEIARNALVHLLVESIPSDVIKWNTNVTAARSTSNAGATEVTLDLEGDASGTATYDFVVGADGGWSEVRKMLTNATPSYTGAQMVTATVRNASNKYPHLLDLIGPGSCNAFGDGNLIEAKLDPQDAIRVYLVVSTPEESWAKGAGLEGKDASEVKKKLIGDNEFFGKWASSLQGLIGTACDEETKANPGKPADIHPLYKIDANKGWEHHPGVTLVGDAAHLMTPVRSDGLNTALGDSLGLAHAIKEFPKAKDAGAWQTAMEPQKRKYEEAMLSRAQKRAEKSSKNQEIHLSKRGGHEIVKAAHAPPMQTEAVESAADGTPVIR